MKDRDLRGRQQLYNGYGDTLARGIELAITPVLFGGLGWLVDRWLGLTPLFTIMLGLFCVVGLGVRMYYAYGQEMAAHEAGAPWARTSRAPRR